MIKWLWLCVVCLGVCIQGRAAWGAGACGPVGSVSRIPFIPQSAIVQAAVQQSPVGDPIRLPGAEGWRVCRADPAFVLRYEGGLLKEAWNPRTNERMAWNQTAGRWEALADKRPEAKVVEPVKPKAVVKEERSTDDPFHEATKVETSPLNFGIDVQALAASASPYQIDGHPATRQQVLDILGSPEADKIPADKDKPWLLAVGPDDFLKTVETELDQTADLKAKVRYQGYKPTAFQLKKFALDSCEKFRASGKAVFLQLTDGKVVHGQFDFKAGDIKLLGQVFDPNRLPDLRNPPKPIPIIDPALDSFVDKLVTRIKEEIQALAGHPVVWMGGIALIIYLWRSKQ